MTTEAQTVETAADALKTAVLDLARLKADQATPAATLAGKIAAKVQEANILDNRLAVAMEAESIANQKRAAVRHTELTAQARALRDEAERITAEARASLLSVWGEPLVNAMDGSGRVFRPIAAQAKDAEATTIDGEAESIRRDAEEASPVHRSSPAPSPLTIEALENLTPRQLAGAAPAIIAALVRGGVSS